MTEKTADILPEKNPLTHIGIETKNEFEINRFFHKLRKGFIFSVQFQLATKTLQKLLSKTVAIKLILISA